MFTKRILLGKDCLIDDQVAIGYLAENLDPTAALVIGDGARIRTGTVIYAGTEIGKGLDTGHNVIIRENNFIGDFVSIWSNSVIDYGCIIGSRVRIHCNVYVAQFTVIEDDVFLAPGVMIANDLHPGCAHSKDCLAGPKIEKGAKIGINVTIAPRVVIGQGTLIGAGSVVTQSIPPFTVAFGNPARVASTIENLVCKTGLTDFPYVDLDLGL
jgi:acetyltransferase-like isoleucine patch superfamily enzyme